MKHKKSFTLFEVVLVAGVVVALTGLVVLFFNPIEYARKGRDSVRQADIQALHTLVVEKKYSTSRVSLGTSQTIYISLSDTSSTCANLSLPTLPSGWSYRCVTQQALRNIDGTGWLPVSLSDSMVFSALPVDPVNSGHYYYAYVVDAQGDYAFATLFESKVGAQTFASKDDGADDARYERGTKTSLWSNAVGLVGYWPFDEGSGLTAADMSGNGNTGTLQSGLSWTQGVKGMALSSLATHSVTVTHSTSLNIQNNLTMCAWTYFSNEFVGYATHPINKWSSTSNANYVFYYFGTTSGINKRIGFLATRGGSWGWISTSLYTITLQKWQHICLSYDSGLGGQLYVDGKKEGALTGSGALTTNAINLILGRIDGKLDEVRIYNRTLPEVEIQALYRVGVVQ